MKTSRKILIALVASYVAIATTFAMPLIKMFMKSPAAFVAELKHENPEIFGDVSQVAHQHKAVTPHPLHTIHEES